MTKCRILCVDDEQNVLNALRRQLRGRFSADMAAGPEEALALFERNGPYGVVLSDMRMPGMTGIELLREVRRRSAETVCMMLTGNNDQQTAVAAVNEGNVFRFLVKPCPPEKLTEALDEATQHYARTQQEKELLEGTLAGSIAVLCEILSILDSSAFGRVSEYEEVAHHVARDLGLACPWELGLALQLSQLGRIAIPTEITQRGARGEPLSAEESAMFTRVPQVSADLVARIPRLEGVAEMIRGQSETTTGAGEMTLGVSALRAILAHAELRGRGMSDADALEQLRAPAAGHDASVLETLRKNMSQERANEDGEMQPTGLSFGELKPGYVLAAPIEAKNGTILMRERLPLSGIVLARLANHHKSAGIVEPVMVFVDSATGEPVLSSRAL